MGLLLWARVRILTSIPRTAVADPAPADAGTPGNGSRPQSGAGAMTAPSPGPEPVTADPGKAPRPHATDDHILGSDPQDADAPDADAGRADHGAPAAPRN